MDRKVDAPLVELVAAPKNPELALLCGLLCYYGEARHLDVEFLVGAQQQQLTLAVHIDKCNTSQ